MTVARVVAVSPQMRLVQDNPASASLLAIYQGRCAQRPPDKQDHHKPIARYYEKLSSVQARGSQASHQVLREVLKEVQSSMVPRTMLREWATATFQSATDYWTFRKVITLQLALAGFAEYVLHLSRLTPNLTELVTSVGVAGPLTASMIAAARCLSHPSFKIQALLRAVLRDEMIAWNKKNVEPTSSITVD